MWAQFPLQQLPLEHWTSVVADSHYCIIPRDRLNPSQASWCSEICEILNSNWLGGTTGSASDQRSEGCRFEAH